MPRIAPLQESDRPEGYALNSLEVELDVGLELVPPPWTE